MTITDASDVCDVCGSIALVHLKCKVICRNCGTIVQSCADLADVRRWNG